MNGFISKNSFEKMGIDAKFGVLFDLQIANHTYLKTCMENHDKKIEQICNEVQNVKSWHSFKIPAVFGVVGGAIAMGGKWIVNLF